MTHGIYRVIGLAIVDPYQLRVEFGDGTEQMIDFRPVLRGTLYRPLQDEELFQRVEIDPEVNGLVWPNGADSDPETLHDWPRFEEEMTRLAACWAQAKTRVA